MYDGADGVHCPAFKVRIATAEERNESQKPKQAAFAEMALMLGSTVQQWIHLRGSAAGETGRA